MSPMRQLFITCAPIFPPNSGYKQSVLGRIWESVQSGHELQVLALNNESDTANKPKRIPVELVGVSYAELVSETVRSPFFEMINLLTREPRFARIFSIDKFRRTVAEIVELQQPDEIVAESIWALGAIDCREWHRVNLVIHDVTVHLLRSSMHGERSWLRKLFHWRDLQRCAAFESNLFRTFSGRFTFLTQEDMTHYQQAYCLAPARCQVASNRLMMSRVERHVRRDAPFLLFPGSVEFHQNFTALKWMAEKVWPLCNDHLFKNLNVIVTGKASAAHRAQLDALGMPIQWMGEVPYSQLDALYATCVCLVSPIISGTGIKVKNLEAVAKGVPLVTTRISARGVESPLCYRAVDDTPEAFAECLKTCVALELNPTTVAPHGRRH